MTFKVTVVNKFSENVLHKGRNGAGVKAELFFIRFDKMFGKHHVSDTKRGRVPKRAYRVEGNRPCDWCGSKLKRLSIVLATLFSLKQGAIRAESTKAKDCDYANKSIVTYKILCAYEY